MKVKKLFGAALKSHEGKVAREEAKPAMVKVRVLHTPPVEREEEPRFVHPFDGCPQSMLRALDEDEVERPSRYVRPEEVLSHYDDPLEAAIFSEELELAQAAEERAAKVVTVVPVEATSLNGKSEIDQGVRALQFADSVHDLAVARNAKPADVAIKGYLAEGRREQQLAAHEAMIAERAMRRAGARRIDPHNGLKRPIWSVRGLAFA